MIHQFKIQIKEIKKPPIWRRVLVPDSFTFHQFHQIIQAAFGWEDAHLYLFSPQGYSSRFTISIPSKYDDLLVKDSRLLKLQDIFHTENQTYTYIYDFGDDWTHKIALEAILSGSSKEASCIAGKGACPPEDCGGAWGYENLKTILKDPKHPEYSVLREWLWLEPDEKWDTARFELEDAQERVAQINIRTKQSKKNDASTVKKREPFLGKNPKFNHPEVEIFYQFSGNIDRKKVHEIMSLPRQSLIEDMQTMLHDYIERYSYFSIQEDNDALSTFPVHALFVLSSLRAEEALETMLFLMKQIEIFEESWGLDIISDESWEYFYWMGKNQTTKLKEFILTPDTDPYMRCSISDTILQIALHHPDRKQEIIEWQTDVIDTLLANINNKHIFNKELLTSLILDIMIIGDTNILPLIKRSIDTGEVSSEEIGSFEEIQAIISQKKNLKYEKYKLHKNIDQFYDDWGNPF